MTDESIPTPDLPRPTPDVPELHRPLAVDRVGPRGLTMEVKATPEECAAVAQRLMLPAIPWLRGKLQLTAGAQGRVAVSGVLEARITQSCVISLEQFDTVLAETFEVVFVPEDLVNEADADPDSTDELPYAGSMIDLGEALVEQLALTLDPYPRKPGAELPAEAQDAPETPFAALARLKRLD